MAYARHFMLMNTKNYFLPPLEKLELYNLGSDKISSIAVNWFHLHTSKATAVSKNLQGVVLLLIPFIFLLVNLYGIWGLIFFIRKGGFRETSPYFKHTIGLISLFLTLNFGFSVFANIVVMRYQVFPMILCLAFVLLLTDYLELRAQEANKLATIPRQEPDTNTIEMISSSHPVS
jgi:hypothetical protein